MRLGALLSKLLQPSVKEEARCYLSILRKSNLTYGYEIYKKAKCFGICKPKGREGIIIYKLYFSSIQHKNLTTLCLLPIHLK